MAEEKLTIAVHLDTQEVVSMLRDMHEDPKMSLAARTVAGEMALGLMHRLDPEEQKQANKEKLSKLVDRFLTWQIPSSELADPCASDPTYRERYPNQPLTGTNFFSADGARKMLIHILELEE